jgi:hypothetical protein
MLRVDMRRVSIAPSHSDVLYVVNTPSQFMQIQMRGRWVFDLADHAMVSMTTRDYQPKIKLFTHANDSGTMGRTLEDALTETASINFKNRAAALQFRKALAHAVNLCK